MFVYLNIIKRSENFEFACHVVSDYNESLSKNPDIETPLVVNFSLGVVIHFSPLVAC